MPRTHERRSSTRIDKVFRVLVWTDETGEQWCVARNVSETGMFIEMAEPLPLNTKVIVRFQLSGDDAGICAIGRVQNHYYLQYAADDGLRGLSGVGLRFLRFLADEGSPVPPDRVH